MRIIKISEIEANDDHRWDNVTLGPITVVLALALAVQVVFGLGCADTNDDPGEDPVVEEDAGVPAAAITLVCSRMVCGTINDAANRIVAAINK